MYLEQILNVHMHPNPKIQERGGDVEERREKVNTMGANIKARDSI